MSYILDALKKSEQQRGHGTTPGIQTVHSSSLNYRHEKRAIWPYILILAVTLNLLAIVYFITVKNTSTETQVTVTENLVIDIADDAPASSMQKSASPTLTTINNPVTQALIISDKSVVKNAETQPVITPAPAKENINKTQQLMAHDNIERPEKYVMDYHELPDSIRQQLPAIIISAHVYSSNHLQRSIVINNNFMEEGEYVLDDLILYEITPDGAIFDYKNTRFHYGVVSGWQ